MYQKNREGTSQLRQPPKSCVSNLANRSQSRSQNCGITNIQAGKDSSSGEDQASRQRKYSGEDELEYAIPALDLLYNEISKCEEHPHQRLTRPGNETTKEIEFVEDEVHSNNENEIRHDDPIQVDEKSKSGMQLANLEEVGYASGPENLEHTTEPSIIADMIGKKRPRRRTKRSKGDDPVIRKKNEITKCEHHD